MTTFREIDVCCAVCGVTSRQKAVASTTSYGSRDLDGRLQGPVRWTLEAAVQCCPGCGFCAWSLEEMPFDVRPVVESAVYRDVIERSDLPELARRLFCAALLNEAGGAPEGAAIRFLEAAWACDDAGALEQARICRERSAEMYRDALATLRYGAPESQVLSEFADVLRRTGRFQEAAAAASQAESLLAATSEDEETARATAVVRYIRDLAEARDDRLHTVDEAVASSREPRTRRRSTTTRATEAVAEHRERPSASDSTAPPRTARPRLPAGGVAQDVVPAAGPRETWWDTVQFALAMAFWVVVMLAYCVFLFVLIPWRFPWLWPLIPILLACFWLGTRDRTY